MSERNGTGRWGSWTGAAMLGLAALAAAACTSPDPEASYHHFVNETADARVTASDAPLEGGGQFDFSGTYLLAVNTSVLRGCPLLFEATVTVRGEPGNQVVDVSEQPLKTDSTDPGCPPGGAARADARTPVGDPVVFTDIPYADGAFTLARDGVQIPGDANPITFSDILANMQLNAIVLSESEYCGTVDGQVLQPIEVGLAGSTFGAVATDDPTTVTDLPLACPTNEGTGQ